MASLCSSMGKIVHRALYVRAPQPLRRRIHGGPVADSTRAADEVEQLAKKTEELAKKEVLLKYVDSLVEEQKKEYGSPNLEGAGIPWFQAVASIALFMAGYRVGLDEATESGFQKLGRKRLY